MDNVVIEIQNWLNETYKGRKNYIPFKEEEIDGIAGVGTFNRLVRALQIELNDCYASGITVDGDFGKGTLKALPTSISAGFIKGNIVKIIQCSLYCKGYDTRPLDNDFGKIVTSAVKKFEGDAGIVEDGVVTPIILQGIMNSDSYKYKGLPTGLKYQQHRVQKALNGLYGLELGLIAPSGLWERKSQKMLIKSCQKAWGITNPDGVWGNNTKSKAPVLVVNSSNKTSVVLLQMALTVNGYYTGSFDGNYSQNVYNAVHDFQEFMCIGADGKVGKGTWASLLISKGEVSRKTTAIDTATRLDKDKLLKLSGMGYTAIGRYLTNVSETSLDKKITKEELLAFKETNMKIIPIYQTMGNYEDYFTWKDRGITDAKLAIKAAENFGFSKETTIYFAVDYDVSMKSITDVIVPYFKDIKNTINNKYKIGVYGSRAVCNMLADEGLTSSSYVSDMSSGFTGNIGQIMPSNWAYDQISEITVAGIGVDKCAASPRATGFVPECNFEIEEPTTNNFIETAHKIKELIIKFETGIFEDDPYAKIAGNFDDMHLSLGICQFNLGQQTLQEILRKMNEDHAVIMQQALGNYYDEIIDISNKVDNFDDSILNAYATENTARHEAMVNLCQTDEFRKIQDDYFEAYIYQAVRRCNISRYSFKTARSFAIMLDTAIQHGALIDDSVNDMYDAQKASIDISNEKERLKLFIDCMSNTVGSFKDDFRDRCYYLYDESTDPHGVKQYLSPISNYGVTDEIISDMPSNDEAQEHILNLIGHTFS